MAEIRTMTGEKSRNCNMPTWRAMRQNDVDVVYAIADVVHADLFERRAVLVEKFERFPSGAFILEMNGKAVGYALAHLWTLGSIPQLDDFLGVLPDRPDCLYLHDVAVLEDARGHGSARNLIDILAAAASIQGLPSLALVSVYGTIGLWSACGFEEIVSPALSEKLAPYGPSARYMVRAAPMSSHLTA